MARFRLAIVANRAYLDHEEPAGEETAPRVAGGLVTVLRPVAGEGTVWVGAGRGAFDRAWVDEAGEEWFETAGGRLRQRRVFFAPEVWHGFYDLTANGFLWPLLHLVRPFPALTSYFPSPRTPSAADWQHFRLANEAYAHAVVAVDAERAWVHDYHLGLVPGLLRERGFRGPIGFFLHTPAPSWRAVRACLDGEGLARFAEWLRGLLGADLVGVQSMADAGRLQEAAAALLGADPVAGGVRFKGRFVAIEAHPVGPDAGAVLEAASAGRDPDWLSALRRHGLPLLAALERADYTKGIPERLRAVARSLRAGARFLHLGIEAPTRETAPGYEAFARAAEEAARVAREAAEAAGLPFEERHQALPWEAVVAVLRSADVVVAPSLADGMNLVPLQAVLAQAVRPPAERGALVVGRETGAAALYGERFAGRGLLLVDPLDERGFSDALARALAGGAGRIGDDFVAAVRGNDARSWARRYLARLEEVHAHP